MDQRVHSYQEIKNWVRVQNILFEDTEFHGTQALNMPKLNDVVWKRVYDITKNLGNPQFVTNDITRFDVNQGKLGNCWFVAAVANLTLNERIFPYVCPADNAWKDWADYTGIFHFRFFVNGNWIEIIVDDKLPTRQNELIFMHSKDPNEFWCCLLEKAYAKLLGNYGLLNQGNQISEAMMHLTSQTSQVYYLGIHNYYYDWYSIIETALQRGGLIASPYFKGNEQGLVNEHAYSITGLKKVVISSVEFSLLRIRNPWGHGEWTGEWSDTHPLWKYVSAETKEELKFVPDLQDGEFWIPLNEWAQRFYSLEICYV